VLYDIDDISYMKKRNHQKEEAKPEGEARAGIFHFHFGFLGI